MSLVLTTRGAAQGRLRRPLHITLIIALLMLGGALAGTAEANVDCGAEVTADTRLNHDVGPCEGHGLIVRADNITLDLRGHRIFGSNGAPEQAGILLQGVSGVAVENGTVEGFDAGVAIDGGGGNTVRRIAALNNVNDLDEPYLFDPRAEPPIHPTPEQMPFMLCLYGDGITIYQSDNNTVEHNQVIGNGPYGGITLVDESDNNMVRRNMVFDSNVPNLTQNARGEDVTGLCGATSPGAPGMQRGRAVQGIGIRVEGPGSDNNLIEGNHVDNSALVGISIHSYVCNPAPGEPRLDQQPNVHNLIARNHVRRTGAETAVVPPEIAARVDQGELVTSDEIEDSYPNFDLFADGIASMAQGPIGRITCTSPDNTVVGNHSMDNARNGIMLARTVERTTVSDNVVQRNAVDGIRVEANAVPPPPPAQWVGGTGGNNTLRANRGHQNGRGPIYEFVDHDNNDETPEVLVRSHDGEDRGHDGHDYNADCDNNNWLRNRFLTVNQYCVAAGGTGWVGGPGRSGQAPGHQDRGPNSAGGRGR